MLGKMLSFFKGLKLTAILGAVIVWMWGWIKILSKQKKILKKENAAYEKKENIIKETRLSDIKIEGEMNEELENNDGSDYGRYI
ncbi:MAG: LapA family protein [Planctomycetes bacterium]|nr:LapA family protein [Planctomycetota bacterium]